MDLADIPELYCPNHNGRINFLDLNRDVPKGCRALCNNCKLMNPTNIIQALEQYQLYLEKQVQQIERDYDLYCEPIIDLQYQFQKQQKQFNDYFEKTSQSIQDFTQQIMGQKESQIKQILQQQFQFLSLNKIQDIEEMLSQEQPEQQNSIILLNKEQQILIDQSEQIRNLQRGLCQFDEMIEEFSQYNKEIQDVILEGKLQFHQAHILIKQGNSNEALDLLNSFEQKEKFLNLQSHQLKDLLLKSISNVQNTQTSFEINHVGGINFNEQLGGPLGGEEHINETIQNYGQEPEETQGQNNREQRVENKSIFKLIQNKKFSIFILFGMIIAYFILYWISSDLQKCSLMINLGHQLKEQQVYIEAIQCYDRVIDLVPNDLEANNNKCQILQILKKFQESINCYNKITKINSNHSEAYYFKGIALENLKLFDEAYQNYDKAVRINSNYSTAYNFAGKFVQQVRGQIIVFLSFDFSIQIILENFQKIKSYNEIIKKNPYDAAAFYNKGIALRQINRTEEAIQSYDRAIKINQNYTFAYNNKGNALFAMQRYEEAIKSFDEAIKLNPQYNMAYRNKCSVLSKMNRYTEVKQCYEKAIQIDPSNANLQKLKGDVLITLVPHFIQIELNEHKDAYKAYKIAIEKGHPDAKILQQFLNNSGKS